MSDEAKKMVGIRVPPTTLEIVRKMSKDEKRPLSNMGQVLIEEAIEARKKAGRVPA
jgi:hypothetical protein